MNSNKRVYLPGPLRENEEIELQQLKYNLKKATERYTEESKHMKSNLTKQQEHLEQYENENSVLWRHCREIHNNERKKFTMNKKETFGKDSMLRQISESVVISRIEKTRLINNKREWNIPRIPTVNISDTIQK